MQGELHVGLRINTQEGNRYTVKAYFETFMFIGLKSANDWILHYFDQLISLLHEQIYFYYCGITDSFFDLVMFYI